MKAYSRKQFLQQSTTLLAASFAGNTFTYKPYKPLLSFSTIGCPNWPLEKIVSFAKNNRYDGLEIRGIQRELNLPNLSYFNSKEAITATIKMVKDNGLSIVDLGSSAALHYRDETERKKNIDEAKKFIDLAAQMNCPFIRVFPNDFPADQDKNTTIDLIAKGLLELGDYANNTNVSVLLESHGQVVNSTDLQTIMQAAKHTHVGMVWDIVNMWFITKEPPTEVYSKLKSYIRHTHIKDLNIVNGKEQYVLLGKGEAPIFEGIDALAKGGYKGYYSFEWEKLWHPEIAEPEIALADYPVSIKRHFNKM